FSSTATPPSPSYPFPYTTLFRSVRLLVCRATLIIQAFEPGAIGGERPPAVGRHPVDQPLQRHIQPHRHAVRVDRGAVLPVHECRSEEHTSELQSPYDLVCRLLLE